MQTTSYGRVRLDTLAVEGVGARPPELGDLPDSVLADLSWVGEPLNERYAGLGLWPVVIVTPEFDPDTHMLTGNLSAPEVDGENQRLVITREVVPVPVPPLLEPPPPPPPPTRAEVIAGMLQTVVATREALVAAGLPWKKKRIQIDGDSLTHLNGMATTALAVMAGYESEWPADFADGWITTDNDQIPLPTPEDGYALGVAARGWFARIVQNTKRLRDALVGALADETIDLAGIDITAGWPVASAADLPDPAAAPETSTGPSSVDSGETTEVPAGDPPPASTGPSSVDGGETIEVPPETP